VTLINRNVLKGAGLLAGFGLKGQARPLDVTPPPSALIVNASTLGMVGMPVYAPDLSAQPDDCLVYDIVYAPLVTPLLAAAEDRGLETIDGLEMLVGQAAVAFELFFGAAPPREQDGELRELLLA
jgi:shikimate dehydrogenase